MKPVLNAKPDRLPSNGSDDLTRPLCFHSPKYHQTPNAHTNFRHPGNEDSLPSLAFISTIRIIFKIVKMAPHKGAARPVLLTVVALLLTYGISVLYLHRQQWCGAAVQTGGFASSILIQFYVSRCMCDQCEWAARQGIGSTPSTPSTSHV